MTEPVLPNIAEQLDEAHKLNQEIISQCKTAQFVVKDWRLEKVEVVPHLNGDYLQATWYFPMGGIFRLRGLEIINDDRFPNFVRVTLNGEAKTLSIQHFRSKNI